MEDRIYIKLSDGSYKEFDLNVINMFAAYALTLKPLPEISLEAGHISALEEELNNNKTLENFKDEYEKINNVMIAKKLLIDTLRLMMMEQTFRLEGITPKALEYYKLVATEYQKYFTISKEIEESIIKK